MQCPKIFPTTQRWFLFSLIIVLSPWLSSAKLRPIKPPRKAALCAAMAQCLCYSALCALRLDKIARAVRLDQLAVSVTTLCTCHATQDEKEQIVINPAPLLGLRVSKKIAPSRGDNFCHCVRGEPDGSCDIFCHYKVTNFVTCHCPHH